MTRQNLQYTLDKNKLTILLAVTSVIGVLLMFVAIYNASRDLEIIHEIDSLYHLAQATLERHDKNFAPLSPLKKLSPDNYQIRILEKGKVTNIANSKSGKTFPLATAELEQSRVNTHGGYIEIKDTTYTWTILPETDTAKQVLFMRQFNKVSSSVFIEVYSKRLLIPAIFYIWLMIWVGLILRFFTNKLKKQNEVLERMAMHDSLTGLANRSLLEDRLEKLIQDCQRTKRKFALAVIDLNKFKEVNDTLGHVRGDELLCQFAERVKSILRAADTFSRIGGDEFVLLLNDADETVCSKMCERIIALASKPYLLKEAKVNIGISIGIAIFPEDGEESITLIRHADKAMYKVKSTGGGIKTYAEEQKTMATTLLITPDKA